MGEVGDIVWISVPFTTGVAAGAAFCAAWSGFGAAAAGAGVSLIACVPLATMLLRGRSRLSLALLFLAAGFFCFCSHRLCLPAGDAAGPVRSAASASLLRLRTLIDSVPFPHRDSNAMLEALLTGDRSLLSAGQKASFREAGASHILALSGLHLGVIYLIVGKLLTVLGNTPAARAARSALCIALSAFYTLMTGAGPSLVRAFLFITFSEICRLDSSRRHDPPKILLAALVVQLAASPDVILSVGFQLSYLAMAGIFFLYPRLSAWYPDSEGRTLSRRIWEGVALTLSCQLFTAPVSWWHFHTFPRHFLLTNIIALPLTSLIMVLSVATLALSAMGGAPSALLWCDDAAIRLLLFVLEAISGM